MMRQAAVPCWMGNSWLTVSCRCEMQSCHVGWETICERFPVGMKRNGTMPPPVISSGAKRSREISGREVSCRYETQSSHAG